MAEQEKRIYEAFESYDDEPAEIKYSRPSPFKIAVKVIFYLFIVLVNGAIIFRVCSAEDPKSVLRPIITEAMREAYSEQDDFAIYTQDIFDMYTEDGLFYSTGMFYTPSAGQLQVSVRYNVRTMPDILIVDELGLGFDSNEELSYDQRENSDFETLSSDIIKNTDYFAFRLTDDSGNIYLPAETVKLTRSLYVFHTFVFEGISNEDTNFYIELYLLRDGEPDYTSLVGKMKVYSYERPLKEYELSRSEISALK